MSDAKATILDLDALMDTNLGTVETLPDFVKPSKGTYRLKVKEAGIKKREVTDKDTKVKSTKSTIDFTYEILATHECEEVPYPDGSLFMERFQATEDGLKIFKKRAMSVLNVLSLDGASVRDVLDGVAGTEFEAAITIRKSTGDNGTEYENINIRCLHESPAS